MRIEILLLAVVMFAPLALAAAVSTVEEFRHAIETPKNKRVVLASGVYALDELIVLTPEHSGLTIEAAAGASPILSGGRKVKGWHPAKLNGRDCWAAKAPVEFSR